MDVLLIILINIIILIYAIIFHYYRLKKSLSNEINENLITKYKDL